MWMYQNYCLFFIEYFLHDSFVSNSTFSLGFGEKTNLPTITRQLKLIVFFVLLCLCFFTFYLPSLFRFPVWGLGLTT